MIRLSWLRRFLKNSKGISTAIGTVLLVVAMFVISSNVLLFTISQNTLYSQAVRESHETDADRFNEKIVASNGNYTVDGDEVTVEADLTNAGGVAAQIINLWVFDTAIQEYNYTVMSLNLGAGDSRTVSVVVTMVGAHQDHTFSSWFVTARGNTVAVEEAQIEGTIVAEVAQGIGYLGMDFDAFVYYEYESAYKLKGYPNGTGSYTVPAGKDVVFRVKLTNYDPSGNKRTLTLNRHSLLWVYFPTQGKQVPWYIVRVNATNGTIKPTYSPDVLIKYKETVYVYFASKSDGTFNGNPDHQCMPGFVAPGAVNLLLLGKIGSQDYGQNIPFVSIYSS